MPKKILPTWEPARLVEGGSRWYILFYADVGGKRERFRITFNLNRINNIDHRRQRGQELAGKLTWWISQGKSPYAFDERKVPALEIIDQPEKYNTRLMDALELARKLKTQSDREDTNRTYDSICNLLARWMEKEGISNMRVGDLRREHAAAYLDHCVIDRKVGFQTYNNNLRDARVIFNCLVDRGYLSENPFNGFPYKKVVGKKRRNFSPEEARIVAAAVYEKDRLLFYALILQYACLIRPGELRRLQYDNIDLAGGVIRIRASQGKNKRPASISIPRAFLHFFENSDWQRPAHWYPFGKGWQPSPDGPCGERTMYNKQRNILARLHKKGLLDNVDGLSWYSWKDSGITNIIEQMGLEPARRQARHRHESTTRKYEHEKPENSKILNFENDLI